MVRPADTPRGEAEIERLISAALAPFRADRDLDDMRQEARLAIWKKVSPAAAPWLLCAVAFAAASDFQRQRDGRPGGRRRPPLSLWQPASDGEDGTAWLERQAAGQVPDFAEEVIRRLEAERLLDWLKRHSRGQLWAALDAHCRTGGSYPDLGARLGISPQRAYQLVQQALNRLRAHLGLAESGLGPAAERARYQRRKQQPEYMERARGYARSCRERKRAAREGRPCADG